jgi:hypothetical protein
MNPCEGKIYCMKQVNPKVPRVYFGTPWEYDDDYLACHLCKQGLGVAYVYGEKFPTALTTENPKLLKRVGLGLLPNPKEEGTNG